MKIPLLKPAGGLMAAALMALSASASAQVTVTETSTTGYGTVSQYSPGQTIVVSQDSGSPISYSVTKQTTFVDESGAPVAEQIATGVPITVTYVRDGDRMVASRVVVKRTVTSAPTASGAFRSTTTTATTTGVGTVSEFAPGSHSIVLRSDAGAAALTYGISSTTTYVDEAGVPVAVEKIAPGVPVTVHYIREGDRMVANRVVVTRAVAVPTRKLTKDEKEQIEERREDAKDRREEAREDAKEQREERREKNEKD